LKYGGCQRYIHFVRTNTTKYGNTFFSITNVSISFVACMLLSFSWFYRKLRKVFLTSFVSFLIGPLLPTHCRCRSFLWHLITLNDTPTRLDSSGRGTGPSQRPLSAQHTTFTRDKEPCPQLDSNTQSQPASGRRPRGHQDRQKNCLRSRFVSSSDRKLHASVQLALAILSLMFAHCTH